MGPDALPGPYARLVLVISAFAGERLERVDLAKPVPTVVSRRARASLWCIVVHGREEPIERKIRGVRAGDWISGRLQPVADVASAHLAEPADDQGRQAGYVGRCHRRPLQIAIEGFLPASRVDDRAEAGVLQAYRVGRQNTAVRRLRCDLTAVAAWGRNMDGAESVVRIERLSALVAGGADRNDARHLDRDDLAILGNRPGHGSRVVRTLAILRGIRHVIGEGPP